MKTFLRWLPALPLLYAALAITATMLLARPIPIQLERLLVPIVAPCLLIYQPLYPILKPAGMVEKKWLTAPSLPGIALGSLIYSTLIWIPTALFRRKHPKPNH